MSGRRLVWLLVPLLALALVAQTLRARDLLAANQTLRQVEAVSVAAAGSGRAAPALYWAHVRVLERAHRLDPADSRILLTLGSQYVLLGRADEAVEVYRRALAVEPRPRIYLNLGRAQAAAGDLDAARESFRRAVLLDYRLRRDLPKELRPAKVR